MRLTAILLLAGCLQAAATVNAQTITYSARNAELPSLFKVIKEQTGFTVVADKDMLRRSRPVSIEAVNMPLKEFLDQILKDQPLVFDIEAQTVVLSKKNIVPGIKEALPQAPPVTGVVRDSTGMPLAGATVTNRRTKKSVQTNAQGKFDIEADPGDGLAVSYIGYENKVVTVQGNSMVVVLLVSTSPLDAIQVQAYGTTSRRIATGNIVTVKGADIARQPVSNPILALAGRVPNLVIAPASGLPNAPVMIQLRGQNSLSSQSLRSEPLIIVDGVPFQNTLSGARYTRFGSVGDQISALSFINPSDIEQIDVLSDADATSIYGSRGGNGVILITTKKGKAGDTKFSAGITLGNTRQSNRLTLLNTEQYLAMRRQAYVLNGQEVPTLQTADKNFTNYDLTLWDPNRQTDWQDVLVGNVTPYLNANASVSGGTETVQYLISGTYNKQRYVTPGKNKYESGGGQFSISGRSPNGKVRLSLSGAYLINNSLSPASDFSRLALRLPPNAPAIYQADGSLNWAPNTSSVTRESSWTNPFAELERTTTVRADNLRSSASVNYEPVNNLVASINLGYSQITTHNLALVPLSSFDPADANRRGNAALSNIVNRSYTVDPQVTYKLRLLGGNLDLLAGASLQGQTNMSESFQASGYTSDALLKDLTAAATLASDNSSNQYKYAAAFGRITYNYENRYIANFTGRRDGSSRFGPGYQFGNFWSLGGAWIFSNEWFVKDRLPFLSFGKLRASVGTNGQDGISDYRYLQLYETVGGASFHDMSILLSRGASNPDYHWESVRKLEAGLEFGLFGDRLVTNVSWWRNRAGDQLGDFPLPATSGALTIVRNMNGLIQNNGWDFMLTAKIIDQKQFGWTLSANYGIQNNKVLSLPDPQFNNYRLSRHVAEGKPFSGFVLLYEFKGLNPATGLYQFTDLDGNITSDYNNENWDQLQVDTRPQTLGITTNLRWGRFSLDCMIQMTKQWGLNYLFNEAFLLGTPGGFLSEAYNIYGNQPVGRLDYWTQPGQAALFQKLSPSAYNGQLQSLYWKAANSDMAYVDASYIRIRNISLSWAMPEAWARRLSVANCTLFVTGQNLLTLTGYDGLDPEVQQSGITPLLKTMTAGIQVGF